MGDLSECSIDGCERPSRKRGWCELHYDHWRKRGDPLDAGCPIGRPGVPRPGGRKGQVTYFSAHSRVRRDRGSARNYTCPCGKPATQWAYNHADPDELMANHCNHRGESLVVAYSVNPSYYVAMCIPCHRHTDRKEAIGA